MILVVNSILGHHEMYLNGFKKRYRDAKIWSTVKDYPADKFFISKAGLVNELRVINETVFFLSLNEWQYYLLKLRATNVHGIFYHQSGGWNMKNILRLLLFRYSRVNVNLLLYRPKIWNLIISDKCNVIADPYMGKIYENKIPSTDKIRIGFLGEISERKGFFRFVKLIDRLDSRIFEFICHGNALLSENLIIDCLSKRENVVEYSLSRLGERKFQEKLLSCHIVFMDYSLMDGSSGILSLSARLYRPVGYRRSRSYLSNHVENNNIGIELGCLEGLNKKEDVLKLIPSIEAFNRFNKNWNNTDAFFKQISL